MLIAGFKIYQLMLFFGIYSIIGYLIEQIFYGFSGYAVKRGFLGGPASLIYGVGGIMTVIFVVPYNMDFYRQIVILLLIAIGLNLVATLMIRIISGVLLWQFSAIYPIIGAAFGLIIVHGGQRVIESVMDIMPTWLIMVILLIIFVPVVSQFIDSTAMLFSYRRDMKRLYSFRAPSDTPDHECLAAIDRKAVCDHKAYGEAVMAALQNYDRWIKAYPHFRRATLKKIFRGCSTLERLDIKEYM